MAWKKIKLIGTNKQKAETFYELLISGDTFSNKLQEFGVNEDTLKLLDKKKLKYKVL